MGVLLRNTQLRARFPRRNILNQNMKFLNQIVSLFCMIEINVEWAFGSVALGFGTQNPANANECLDPETGLNHTIGIAWTLPGVCGEASCENFGEDVYISYTFCGSTYADYPCYLSAETHQPYPSCCPRSFCPEEFDIAKNAIDTDYYNAELQSAAGITDYNSDIRSVVSSKEEVVSYDLDMDDSYNDEEYQIDWDSVFKDADLKL